MFACITEKMVAFAGVNNESLPDVFLIFSGNVTAAHRHICQETLFSKARRGGKKTNIAVAEFYNT